MFDGLADWIFVHLAGDPEESVSPPGSEICKRFGPDDLFTATTYNNDGFELWIAYTDSKWIVHFNAREARALARIILWDWWIASTWLGLKRTIWYWALHQRCNRWREIDRI